MAAELNAQHGVAELATSSLAQLESKPQIRGILSHERRTTPGNPYHGNLLFNLRADKKHIRMIANALALHSSLVPPTTTDAPAGS